MDNLAKTRVVDPVLSTLARGFRHEGHIFEALFPIVEVTARAGKIVAFGAEHFAKRALERAPGETRKRLSFGYEGEAYALVQRALDGELPIERLQEGRAAPGIGLGQVTVAGTMQSVFLQIEIAAATLATTAGSYTGAHTAALANDDKWSHDDSDPLAKVNEAKELIAADIGVWPNTLIVGPAVHLALMKHPDVLDRVKHTTGLERAQVGEAELAAFFDIPTYKVGRARHGAAGNFQAAWGKNAVLAYVGKSSLGQAAGHMGEPSFGYTYRLADYPVVAEPRYDDDSDTWLYPVTTEDSPVIAGKDAGYLWTSVVA